MAYEQTFNFGLDIYINLIRAILQQWLDYRLAQKMPLRKNFSNIFYEDSILIFRFIAFSWLRNHQISRACQNFGL